MSFIPGQQTDTGSFIPTTGSFEVSHVYTTDVNSPDFKELIARLFQMVITNSNVLNLKDTGFYLQEEFATGQLYFNGATTDPLKLRPVFRKVIDMGALGAGVTSIAHGLTPTADWRFVHIYGAANGTPNFYPLPFVSAAGATNIEVRVNATNVIVTNNSGVAFASAYVVLEYVKF